MSRLVPTASIFICLRHHLRLLVLRLLRVLPPSVRILTPLPTRLNLPEHQIPFKTNSVRIYTPDPHNPARDPHNPVRHVLGNARDTPRAPGKALTSIFKNCSLTKKCLGTNASVGAKPNAKCFTYSEIQSTPPPDKKTLSASGDLPYKIQEHPRGYPGGPAPNTIE